MLWDLNEAKHLYSLEAGDVVNALVFSPNRYWLCAATASCIKIFDLESKYVGSHSGNPALMLMCDIFRSIVDELKPERSDTSKVKEPVCMSIAWSADGQTLFGGFTDDLVRVWSVIS